MDQQNTMPPDALGNAESSKTIQVSEETVAEHQTDDNSKNKESPIDETNDGRLTCGEDSNVVADSKTTTESKNEESASSGCSLKEDRERADDRLVKVETTSSSESTNDNNRLKIELPLDNPVTELENITSDTVEGRDAASITEAINETKHVDESPTTVSTVFERNCKTEKDDENIAVDTANDGGKLDVVRSSVADTIDAPSKVQSIADESAQCIAEKRIIDQQIVSVVTAPADESSDALESKETIEEMTESIEYSVIEYPEGSVADPGSSNVETIELIVDSSGEMDNDVFISSEDVASNEADAKPVSHCVESSTITRKSEACISVASKDVNEKIEKLVEDNGHSVKEETCLTEESVDRIVKIAGDSAEVPIDKIKDEAVVHEKVASVSPSVKQRSVIEDIFDDWQDENPDDECQPPALKAQDSVEMELKILLDGEKPAERQNNGEEINRSDNREPLSAVTMIGERSGLADSKAHVDVVEVSQLETVEFRDDRMEKRKESLAVKETITGFHRAGKAIESSTVRERITKQKPLAPRPGVKVPGFLLTSPIVSKTAVSKVLKERLREQQKEFDSPGKPDIFFVKKITQRLSHKLAAASAAQVPGLVPLPQIGANVDTNRGTKASPASEEKRGSNVDKELLAILEGDVDPDWSNLKPPTLVSEAVTKSSSPACTVEHNSPPKLDPLVERELALKQLLELPSSPVKKIVAKKGPAKLSKASKGTVTKAWTGSRAGAKKESSVDSAQTISRVRPDERIENVESTEVKLLVQESKIDETRSGRKRRPTEKAREHEQNSTKRLKVFKAKSPGNIESQTYSAPIDKNEAINASATDSAEEELPKDTRNDGARTPPESTDDVRDASSSRRVEAKKVMPKPSAKRKLPAGQKYIRQKMPANKKPTVSLKSKFPKKATAKVMSHKRQKQRNGEPSAGETKPKKKVINEIDRLLQDEGVVNLLYDVEQPGKKRLVPITKSQTKVMDLQKIQRELKIRTKLVRNAVLRLRTSNINTSKVSPRSKRSVSHNTEAQSEKKSGDQIKSGQSTITSPTDFIFPAKIRNAADASIIIRRHSSSSFSSASASPRASVDAPERLSLESGKVPEGFSAVHLLRSNKRRRSQEVDEKRDVEGASDEEEDDDEEEKKEDTINDMGAVEKKKTKRKKKPQPHSPELKRNRKRTVERSEANIENSDTATAAVEIGLPKSKAVVASSSAATAASSSPSATSISTPSAGRTTKKVDAKKNSKFFKQQQQQVDVIDVDEGSSGKVATRSNGPTGGGKIMGKSKKSVKCKVSFAKESEPVKKLDGHEGEDELSVCLAEAVTALSNDSGGPSRSRSTIPVNRNRTKGNSNSIKIGEIDGNKSKLETRVQFSNNEINVQRHGNLVQLLITPTTTTKLRNGITLQVMQQLRETLSILKKDEDCRVVLVTSTGSSFCEGLELSTLLHDNKEERRLRAEELANGVKEFIKSLATFNKPIVAGVQGSAVGLGVTMLPWFDLVIASDKATFSTPYGKLGQIAEGAAIFTLSHILGSAVTSELLLGGRTLTANEALRAGLVTRVLWPDRFQAELLPSLRAMSEQSSQSMEATKALLRHSLRKKLDAALESESYLLVQHWCSAECQAAITAYVDEKIQ